MPYTIKRIIATPLPPPKLRGISELPPPPFPQLSSGQIDQSFPHPESAQTVSDWPLFSSFAKKAQILPRMGAFFPKPTRSCRITTTLTSPFVRGHPALLLGNSATEFAMTYPILRTYIIMSIWRSISPFPRAGNSAPTGSF